MNQEGILTEIKNENLIKEGIKKILGTKKFDSLRANIPGFEPPVSFSKVDGDGSFVPDITATKDGEKNYYELAIKNKNIQETVSKWKLLSQMAQIKNGKFFLIIPRGNFAFAQRTMEKYGVRAGVIKL